jgi:hypothetical protein
MSSERRAQSDRRQRDVGPPDGWGERRRRTERRLPAAEEAAMSADEFARLFGAAIARSATNDDPLLDQAADVLSRARDRY